MILKPEEYFYVHDGRILKNLDELKRELVNIDEATFSYHVNEQKNDFYNWIKGALKEEELAEKIKNDIVKDVMIKHLNEPVKKVVITEIKKPIIKKEVTETKKPIVKEVEPIEKEIIKKAIPIKKPEKKPEPIKHEKAKLSVPQKSQRDFLGKQEKKPESKPEIRADKIKKAIIKEQKQKTKQIFNPKIRIVEEEVSKPILINEEEKSLLKKTVDYVNNHKWWFIMGIVVGILIFLILTLTVYVQ
jgi:Fe2+ transport system protein B